MHYRWPRYAGVVLTPTLPPFPWTEHHIAPKPSESQILAIINRLVNRGILPDTGHIDRPNDPWQIAPDKGRCHDYAVTKQWLLTALGISSQLCECIAPDGEHHMVLIVGDVVLDNLTEAIGPMRYEVVRMQSATNSDDWEAA